MGIELVGNCVEMQACTFGVRASQVWNNLLVPNDGVTSQDDADDEIPGDDTDTGSASLPSQAAGSEDSEEEPSGEPDEGRESPASTGEEYVLPSVSPEQISEQMLVLERRRDAQRNRETRPPDGETVTLRSITVAEVYVGQEVDLLATSFREIDWMNFDESIADEITKGRRGDEYYHTPFILASSSVSDLTLRGYGHVSLPDGIERVYGQIYVLGPSLVAVVLTFILTVSEARRLDTALRDDAESRMDQVSATRYSPKTVYHVKAERIRSIRNELSERCLAWLKEKLPGRLAAGSGLEIPLCMLLSFAQGKPFQVQAPYMRLLDLNNSIFASRLARPDFLFVTPRIGRTRQSEFITAFNEADAISPGSYPVLSAVPEIAHEAMSPFVTAVALEGVLRSFELRMRDIRSDLERLDFDHATDSQVVELRNKLLGLSRDIAIVCGDVSVLVDDAVTIWADYPQLIPVVTNLNLPTPAESTADVERRNLRSIMKDLQAQEAGLRELTLITSQSISDTHNMQLQAKVLTLTGRLTWLTVILVVLTIAVLFVAIDQLVAGSTGSGGSGVAPHASTSANRSSTTTPNRRPQPRPSPTIRNPATLPSVPG